MRLVKHIALICAAYAPLMIGGCGLKGELKTPPPIGGAAVDMPASNLQTLQEG